MDPNVEIATDPLVMWVAGAVSHLPSRALQSGVMRLLVPHLLRERSIEDSPSHTEVYDALRIQSEHLSGSRAHIRDHRESRMLGSPEVLGLFDSHTETMTVRTAGRKVLDGYMKGKYRLTGDPARDAARLRMLGWTKAEMAVGLHESIHSLATGPVALSTHRDVTMAMPYGRVFREGLTERATGQWLDRAIERSGLHRIEPALLTVPYESHYPAEVAAVGGIVDSAATVLGISAEDMLTRLIHDGTSDFAINDLSKEMATRLVGEYGPIDTVATALKRAMTRPLADLENEIPNTHGVVGPDVVALGDEAARAIRDRVGVVVDAACGLAANPYSYEATKPHYEALARITSTDGPPTIAPFMFRGGFASGGPGGGVPGGPTVASGSGGGKATIPPPTPKADRHLPAARAATAPTVGGLS